MRHQKFGRKLNRDIKERKSLFKNLVNSLIEHGKIETTIAKAKAIRGLVDKLVNRSKDGTLSARRQIASFLNRADVVKKLVDVIGPKFKGRTSGYTRIVKTNARRGDGAEEVIMEWVENVEEVPTTKTSEKTTNLATKKEKATPQNQKPAPNK